jgi:hypothetical protein
MNGAPKACTAAAAREIAAGSCFLRLCHPPFKKKPRF